MCQALRELMKEEIAQEMQKGCEEAREKGRTEGRAEGNILTLYGLYSDGDITLQKAAARAGMSEPAFLEAAKKISGM